MQLALIQEGKNLPYFVSQKGNIITVGKVVTTLSRFRRISSLVIEVKDHEKFRKDGMIFGIYGPGDD